MYQVQLGMYLNAGSRMGGRGLGGLDLPAARSYLDVFGS